MVRHFDHITLVVRDVDAATRFFGVLGFQHERSVVISGETFSAYMGVLDIEAEHVTLVLTGAIPRAEVQLLSCGRPVPDEIVPDAHAYYGPDVIDIIVTTPPIDTGDVACYAWYPSLITLDQPIGDRTLFDASAFPLVQRWPK